MPLVNDISWSIIMVSVSDWRGPSDSPYCMVLGATVCTLLRVIIIVLQVVMCTVKRTECMMTLLVL